MDTQSHDSIAILLPFPSLPYPVLSSQTTHHIITSMNIRNRGRTNTYLLHYFVVFDLVRLPILSPLAAGRAVFFSRFPLAPVPVVA